MPKRLRAWCEVCHSKFIVVEGKLPQHIDRFHNKICKNSGGEPLKRRSIVAAA